VETEQHDQESNFYVPTLEELMDKLEEWQQARIALLDERKTQISEIKRLELENVNPKILIGLEHATLLGGNHVHEGRENEPLASETKLGWVVYGRQWPETENEDLAELSIGESSSLWN
jgi:hypothetical protein